MGWCLRRRSEKDVFQTEEDEFSAIDFLEKVKKNLEQEIGEEYWVEKGSGRGRERERERDREREIEREREREREGERDRVYIYVRESI